MDITAMRAKMQRCKNAGSIYYHKGRQVATYDPLPIEKRALAEAQEILQKHGAGAMFSVYQQLAERYKSLVVLLPVSQSITDQTIARALQQMQLVVVSTDKMYCLSWYFGISAKTAKQHVAEMFNTDAEGTLRDVREMLTYALHLCQTAKTEMQQYQNQGYRKEKEAEIELLKKHLDFPEYAEKYRTEFLRNIPNGGADLISIEDERIYNYVTSAFPKQIANNSNAYAEHQRWRRELLLTLGQDDSAGDAGGGVNIGM